MIDPIHAEAAKVFAQLTPGGEGPGATPKVESQRVDAAHAGLSVFARICEEDDTALLGGGVERVQLAAQLGRRFEARRVEKNVVDLLAQTGRQDCLDLPQGAVGGLGQFSATPGFHHAGAEHQSGNFFAIEHERRNIEVAAQGVADAGFAGDGHAGELQVLNIAVDGAMGDLQLFGEAAGGLQPAAAEELHNTEEAVGAAHSRILDGGVESDAVSLRVANLRDPADVGDVVFRFDDLAAGLLDAGEYLIDAAFAVEVDDGAVGGGTMAFAVSDAAGDAGPFVGEDGHAGKGCDVNHRSGEDSFVEAGGASEVGCGDFEPGDGGGGGLFCGGHGCVLSFWELTTRGA